MRSPGVQVRPIRQLSGESEFNEVFLDEVYIPDSQRLGGVQEGWKVALTTLMFERLTVGTAIGLIDHTALLALARKMTVHGRPALEDPRTRERLARWYINDEGLRLLNCRAITALSLGRVPGPEQSINKIIAASQAQEIASYALELLGEAGVLAGDDLGPNWRGIERSWAMSAGMRIAGGTDEILRNIIAERVLGLPAEIRVDKDLPFDQLPH
jgi:acyl-CoA dehydrogenase